MYTHNWIAFGKVQGVGFRYFTCTIAIKYKLTGWVKNLSDGSVEIIVQGNEDRISNLKKYLLKGNMFIKVRELKEEVTSLDELFTFEIKY